MLGFLSIFLIICIWEVHLLPSASNFVNFRRVKVSVDPFSGSVRLVNNRQQSVELMEKDGKLLVQRVSNDADRFEDCYGSSYLGIFGVFKIPQAYCLGVITKSVPVASATIQDLHAIDSVNFIRIPQSRTIFDEKLSAKQSEAERLLLDTLRRHSLLFSTTGNYDVTKCLQANVLDSVESGSRLRCDDRFFWNLNSNKVFLDHGLDSFVTPVTNAFITTDEIVCGEDSKKCQLTMISRRNRFRQGPRYIKRGSDVSGNVANFVETEQIVQSQDGSQLSSFVQIRGSIPLLWTQPSNKWRRKQIASLSTPDLLSHVRVLKLHLRDLYQKYCGRWIPSGSENERHERALNVSTAAPTVAAIGTISDESSGALPGVFFINLIDKVGRQGILGQWLYQAFRQLSFSSSSSPHSNLPARAAAVADLPLNRDVTTWYDFLCTKKSTRSNPVATASADAAGSFLTRYIWFDYHHRCKGGDFSQCKELLPLLFPSLEGDQGGFFSAQFPTTDSKQHVQSLTVADHRNQPWRLESPSKMMSLQSRVIRTNCMDCLDRTNVVQSMVSQWALERQLLQLNPGWKNTHSELYSNVVRRMWTSHGDHLSFLYAGSRAMKREVTKTGSQSYRGAMEDAVSFCQRYMTNNYFDSEKQRGLDILLGNSLEEF